MKFSHSKFLIGLVYLPFGFLFAQTDVQLRDPEFLIDQYNKNKWENFNHTEVIGDIWKQY